TRWGAAVACARAACSSDWKGPISCPLGLSAPIAESGSSTSKPCRVANATPAAAISRAEAMRVRLRPQRSTMSETAAVVAAPPARATENNQPICAAENPAAERYSAKITDRKPYANIRTARAATSSRPSWVSRPGLTLAPLPRWRRARDLGERRVEAVEERDAGGLALRIGVGHPALEDRVDPGHLRAGVPAVAQVDLVHDFRDRAQAGIVQPEGLEHSLERAEVAPVPELSPAHVERHFLRFRRGRVPDLRPGVDESPDQPGARQPVHVGTRPRHPALAAIRGDRGGGHPRLRGLAGSERLPDSGQASGGLHPRRAVEEIDPDDLGVLPPQPGEEVARPGEVSRPPAPRVQRLL